jgi:hypothetical protein
MNTIDDSFFMESEIIITNDHYYSIIIEFITYVSAFQ